jgi:hypothetical protein
MASSWTIRLGQYADKFVAVGKEPERGYTDVTGAGKENTHAVMMGGYFPRKKRFTAPPIVEPRPDETDVMASPAITSR